MSALRPVLWTKANMVAARGCQAVGRRVESRRRGCVGAMFAERFSTARTVISATGVFVQSSEIKQFCSEVAEVFMEIMSLHVGFFYAVCIQLEKAGWPTFPWPPRGHRPTGNWQ